MRCALALAALCVVLPTSAATIDIRDCPLNTLVFVDPWVSGSSFTVIRVGTNRSLLCEDGIEPSADVCQGPYGDMVLEGMFKQYESSESETMSAVWSVIDGVPCCGWNVEKGSAAASAADGFTWFDPQDTPLLKDMPWLTIESDYGEDFGNPLVAATCELR